MGIWRSIMSRDQARSSHLIALIVMLAFALVPVLSYHGQYGHGPSIAISSGPDQGPHLGADHNSADIDACHSAVGCIAFVFAAQPEKTNWRPVRIRVVSTSADLWRSRYLSPEIKPPIA